MQDAELSLRKAVETLRALPGAERTVRLKHIEPLAERLLTARLKGLRARRSALTKPARKNLNAEQASQLFAHSECSSDVQYLMDRIPK